VTRGMFGGTTSKLPTAEPNPLDDMMQGLANMFGAGGSAVEPPGGHHAPSKPPGSNPVDGFMQGLSALLGNPTGGQGVGEGGGGGGGGGREASQGKGQGGLPHMEEWRKLRGLPDQGQFGTTRACFAAHFPETGAMIAEESHQDAQKRPGAPRTGSPTVLPQGCIRIGCCSLRRVKPSKNLLVTKVDSWSEAVTLGLDKGDELVSLGMIGTPSEQLHPMKLQKSNPGIELLAVRRKLRKLKSYMWCVCAKRRFRLPDEDSLCKH
jgi:hypothetical protein